MRKQRIIQVPKGAIPKIAKAYRCSSTTVYNALAGRSNSDNARIIRKAAVSHYGGVQTWRLVL